MSTIKQNQPSSTVESNIQITLNPNDLSSLIELMDLYGNSGYKFFGKDEEGQSITISIWPDYIVADTLQKNEWTRRNIYYRDGYREELFDKDGNFE